MAIELPAELDSKAKKKLEAYCKKIKQADVWVERSTDRGLPTVKVSFASYDRNQSGYMEVLNINAV